MGILDEINFMHYCIPVQVLYYCMSASNPTKRKVSSNDVRSSLQKKQIRHDKPEELTSSSASTNVSTNPSTTKSSGPVQAAVAVARTIDTTAKPTENAAACIVAVSTGS